MYRATWILCLAAFVAVGAFVGWLMARPSGMGPVATAYIAPSKAPAAVAPAPEGTSVAPETETRAAPSSPVAPSFDVVRVAPTGSAVIAGRAAPGAEVTIKDGDKEVGRVMADQRGEWVFVPTQPLSPGTHALVVEATDGTRSEDVAILVPEQKEKAETPLAVLLPKDAPPRPLQGPAAAPPGALTLDAVEYDENGRVVIGGQAKPGARIQIYLGGAPLASATADDSGRWATKPTKAVDPGLYTLRADEVGRDGRVVARVSVPFQRAIVTAGGPGDQVVVQPGDNLWNIARQNYGAGPRYAVIYAANQTEIRDPDLIYPGQVFRLPASATSQN